MIIKSEYLFKMVVRFNENLFIERDHLIINCSFSRYIVCHINFRYYAIDKYAFNNELK